MCSAFSIIRLISFRGIPHAKDAILKAFSFFLKLFILQKCLFRNTLDVGPRTLIAYRLSFIPAGMRGSPEVIPRLVDF